MKQHHAAIALTSLIVSACNLSSEPGENLGETQDDLVFYPISINPLAGKPMSGTWPTTSGSNSDSTVCRECSYTNRVAYPHDDYPLAFNFDTWRNQFPKFGSSTGMPEALQTAKAQADAHLNGNFNRALNESLCYAWAFLAVGQRLKGGTLSPSVDSIPNSGAIQSALNSGIAAPSLICSSEGLRDAVASKVLTVGQNWALAFPPEYARHLKSQYVSNGLGYSNQVYTEPQCLAEMDGRASKSYCAMRQAALTAAGAKLDLGGPSFRVCYDDGLRRNPELTGRVTLCDRPRKRRRAREHGPDRDGHAGRGGHLAAS